VTLGPVAAHEVDPLVWTPSHIAKRSFKLVRIDRSCGGSGGVHPADFALGCAATLQFYQMDRRKVPLASPIAMPRASDNSRSVAFGITTEVREGYLLIVPMLHSETDLELRR
jgi:hypothetical protein